MEKFFNQDILFKIGGFIFGIAILGYANLFSIKFIKANLKEFMDLTRKDIDKLFNYSEDMKVKHEGCKVEIDNLKDSFLKLEGRCYERHSKH